MIDEQVALLRNIRSNPHDDLSRLVYADWVEERGDQPMAELIRCHIERERLDPQSPQHFDLVMHTSMLLAQHRDRWTAELNQRFGVTGVEFVRGMPTEIEIPFDAFEAVSKVMFSLYPIRHVKWSGVASMLSVYHHELPEGVRRSLTARVSSDWFLPEEADRSTFELLAASPARLEPHLADGHWVILAFATWSAPDRQIAEAWYNVFADDPLRVTDGIRWRVAAREFNDPNEFERWCPVPTPMAGPHWIELENGRLISHRRGFDLPEWMQSAVPDWD